MKFFITQHCKERYLERVFGGLNTSNHLLKTILNDLYIGKNITSEISEKHIRFLLYVKEKYGNKGYNFIKNNNTIFITTKRKGTIDLYDVLTCYDMHNCFTQFDNSIMNKSEIYLKLKTI